ncbi:hypothetical protein ACQPUR_03410 [Clostridium neonatale]|uniref:hypothetical protein n=1 Tax=Clostridium neonatale TaxID=137838 RepID=UPI003D3370DE
MNIKRWTSIKNGQTIRLRKEKIHNGGVDMEAVLVRENKRNISSISKSIKYMQNIASEHIKTQEDEKNLENKLREILKEQGYTRI